MSEIASRAPLAAANRPFANSGLLLAAFTVSLFASAFLLFSVQPIVSHLVLPRLGGSPAVWNTCVCFFQAALLLGYGYAHLSSTRLQPRSQMTLHALVFAAALTFIPLSMGVDVPPDNAFPVIWLLTLLTITTGLPFVAIAATAPLLQSWFARTSHPHSKDPYFLYAASNAGSLVALVSYPVLIETTLGLSAQIQLWSIGFAVTGITVLACGIAALLHKAAPVIMSTIEIKSAAVGMIERLRWVTLAFVPSALMLAITTHITTDIAAIPLFWVLPLAIYILTFVFAFARHAPLRPRIMLAFQGLALAATGMSGLFGTLSAAAMLVPLAAFALTAAVCHAELAARRPGVQHLTGYFLLISMGGALGGLLNALVAPLLFQTPLEYPLLLVAACLMRPPADRLRTQARENWAVRGDLLLPFALITIVTALLWASSLDGPAAVRQFTHFTAFIVLAAALLWFAQRRIRLALVLAVCLFGPILADASFAEVTTRSFFGVLRVQRLPLEDLVILRHGTTMHGMQSTRPGEELTPLGYYHAAGSFGRFFAAMAKRTAPIADVGVIGLGIGGLGCYAQPGAAWTFYEIDPMVERLARDNRWFHSMAGCGNHPDVKLGDGRIKLAADSAARYDILIVDAFSSDSVPVHLLTREALALYLARLKPGGTMLFHVTNRYLDLAPVVARLALDAGAPARHLFVPAGDDVFRQTRSEVVAVGTPGGELNALADDGWDIPQAGPVLWTDERSDVLGVIRWY